MDTDEMALHELDDYQALLERLWDQPEDVVDFKEPFNLNSYNKRAVAAFAKDIIGLANCENGGYIIIGKEDKCKVAVNCDQQVIDSFDPSNFHKKISGYSDPSPTVKVFHGKSPEGTNAILIVVKEFSEVPHICAKTVEAEDPKKPPIIRKSAMYIRTASGSAETKEMSTADEMRALLNRAVLKSQNWMLSRIRQLFDGKFSPVLSAVIGDERLWPADQSSTVELLQNHVQEPFIQISAHPASYQTDLFTPVDLHKKTLDALFQHRGWSFPCPKFEFEQATLDSQGVLSLVSDRPFGQASIKSAFAAKISGIVSYREELDSSLDGYGSPYALRGVQPLWIPWVLIVLYRSIGFMGRFFDFGPDSPRIHVDVQLRGILGRLPCKSVNHSLNHLHPYPNAKPVKSSSIDATIMMPVDLLAQDPITACYNIACRLMRKMGVQVSEEVLKRDINEIASD